MKRILVCLLVFFGTAQAQFSLYLEKQIPIMAEGVSCIEISTDGRFAAFGDGKGLITVWDLGAQRLLHQLKGHRDGIHSIVYDSKIQRLISGGKDHKVLVWDLYSGRLENTLDDFRSEISKLALSPDDRYLAASGSSSEIVVWEFPAGIVKGRFKGHKGSVPGLAFSIHGDQLVSVGEDRLLILWNVQTQQIIRKTNIESRTISGSGIDIRSVAFSFDRQFVGVGIEEHILAKGGRSMIFKYNLSFFDLETGTEIETMTGNRKKIDFFTVTPDKQYAVTDNSTLQNPSLAVWNIQKGLLEQNLPLDGEITALAISQNGKWLAVADRDPANRFRSRVHVYQTSGMEGYERFGTKPVATARQSGFGAAMKLTTPSDPLIFGERKRIAVLNFDSPGLEEDIARTTSYLLEGKLANSPYVELVERNQIQQVLEELRYQQSGLTTSDAVQVGKHLNAEYILIGSINKLGNLLIITAKVVDIETSQIRGTREVQCDNATIESISDMVALLAPALVRF